MLKRWAIEITIIFSLLLVSMIYGAVMVRDVQTPQTQVNLTRQEIIIPRAQTQATAVSVGQSSQSESAPVIASPGISKAGNSFSSVISRFFLAWISSIAGLVDSVIQMFL
jgi:hypothetical protein